jgi:hypothetical protein
MGGRAFGRENTEERADWEPDAQLEPWLQLVPRPRIHADFAPTSSLAATHEQRAAPVVKVGFAERERFLDAQPRAPEDHDQAT